MQPAPVDGRPRGILPIEVEPARNQDLVSGESFSSLLTSEDPLQRKRVALSAARILGQAVRSPQNNPTLPQLPAASLLLQRSSYFEVQRF